MWLSLVLSVVSFQAVANFESPRLTSIRPGRCQIEEVLAEVKPIYRTTLRASFYDDLVFYTKFPHHPAKAIEDKKRFPLKSEDFLLEQGSTNEVGFLLYLKRRLRSSVGVSLIPAKHSEQKSRDVAFDHVAGLISCQDGVLLLDPQMNVFEPVLIKKDHKMTFARGIGNSKWTVSQNEGELSATVEPKNTESNSFTLTYELKHLKNADAVVSSPRFVSQKTLSLFQYSAADAPFYHLEFDLQTLKVQFFKMDSESGIDEEILSFEGEEFFTDPAAFEKKLKQNSELDSFGVDKPTLFSRVKAVLEKTKKGR